MGTESKTKDYESCFMDVANWHSINKFLKQLVTRKEFLA